MAHEDLAREYRVEGSSDRSFGFVFSAVFLVVAFWPLLHAAPPRWWAVGISVGFAVIALLKSELLGAINRKWIKLGLLLGKVLSPIALGILFFGVLTPLGVVMRLAGKDPLGLNRDPSSLSYWKLRAPPGPPPDSMTNQF